MTAAVRGSGEVALPLLAPMLAVSGRLAGVRDGFAAEWKWDGVRVLLAADGHEVRLTSRRCRDVTHRYPELHTLAVAVPGPVLLDGEVVALDERARVDFARLQRRMNLEDPARIASAARHTPVVYLAFDLLHDRSGPLLDAPYEQRRERLAALDLSGRHWRAPPHHLGDPADLLDAARELGMEGIVAKRLGSTYQPGARSRDWRKIPLVDTVEVVVGGYAPVRTTGAGIGALLVGYRDGPGGPLRFAGGVGSGIAGAEARRLQALLTPLVRDTSPFADPVDRDEAVFVEPEVVVEVRYRQWTRDGRLRHPIYVRLRPDRDAEEIFRENGEV